MGLPFYQVDADFLASTSKLLARRIKRSRYETIGRVCDLIQFVVDRTSTDEKPPDGIFLGPDAPAEIEAGAEWDGTEGAFADALIAVGMLERLELGLRFRGTDRYREYWEKRRRDKEYRERRKYDEPISKRHRNDIETPRREEKRIEENKIQKPIAAAPIHKSHEVVPVQKPAVDREQWEWADFQQWAQYTRQKGGYVPEDPLPIVKIEAWWHEARKWTGGAVQPLCDAFIAFGHDTYWEKQAPPYPFKAFVSQWKKYMPEVKRVARG